MCGHNLVIGNKYRLFADKGCKCVMCKYEWQATEGVLANYIGDLVINAHSFRLIQPFPCPQCKQSNDIISILCGGDAGPIDVTQEFLSLPVRSRE